MRRQPRRVRISCAPSAVVSGQALIEGVVGAREGLPIPRGRRIDGEELGLRWAPGRSDRAWMLQDTEMPEDGAHDVRVSEGGEDAHLAVAGGAAQGVDLVDAGEELSPAASGASVGRVWAVAAGCRGSRGARVEVVHPVAPVARRLPAPLLVGAEVAVVAVAVHTRRRNQACDGAFRALQSVFGTTHHAAVFARQSLSTTGGLDHEAEARLCSPFHLSRAISRLREVGHVL